MLVKGATELTDQGEILHASCYKSKYDPDNKVRGANMGPIWGRQDPDGPHVRWPNELCYKLMFFVVDVLYIFSRNMDHVKSR